MTSPAFSPFRSFIDLWDSNINLDNLISSEDISFFFTKGGDIYGGTEDARLCFARMKHPDGEESDKNWAKEANFSGMDLQRAIKGEKVERVFGAKELDDIKVIPEEEAIAKLKPQLPKAATKAG